MAESIINGRDFLSQAPVRLQVGQSVIQALSDRTRIASFVVKLIKDLPGVLDCEICIEENTSPVCEKGASADACPWLDEPLEKRLHSCQLVLGPGIIGIPLCTQELFSGLLFIRTNDSESFDHYRPLLLNLADFLAMRLENLRQKELLEESNRQYQQELLQRREDQAALAQRAKELTRMNLELKMAFENSPSPLLVENFSVIRDNALKIAATEESPRRFFQDNPQTGSRLRSMIRIDDANKAALKLFEANSKSDFFNKFKNLFLHESSEAAIEELTAIVEGRTSFASEAVTRTIRGQEKRVRIEWNVAPGYESNWGRVLVSIIDFTSHFELLEEKKRRVEELEREAKYLERLGPRRRLEVAAASNNGKSLREGLPEVFKNIANKYMDILGEKLDQEIYAVNHDVTDAIISLADELGRYSAGPRDVVEIHSAALKAASTGASEGTKRAVLTEGRMLVLELMGRLADFYRRFYTVAQRSTDKDKNNGKDSSLIDGKE